MNRLPVETTREICHFLVSYSLKKLISFAPWNKASYLVWMSPEFRSRRLYHSGRFFEFATTVDWKLEPMYQILFWISREWTYDNVHSDTLTKLMILSYQYQRKDICHMMHAECSNSDYYSPILQYEGVEGLEKAILERISVCPKMERSLLIAEDFEFSCKRKEEDVCFTMLNLFRKMLEKEIDGLQTLIRQLNSIKVMALYIQPTLIHWF